MPPGSAVAPVGPRAAPYFEMAVRTLRSDAVSRNVRQRGFWEIQTPQEMADLANESLPLVSADDPTPRLLLDVGANIGFHSLLFAHFGWNAVAVEPMPQNLQLLNVSLCLNPSLARRVAVVPVALSSAANRGRRCVVRADGRRYGGGGIGNGVLFCEQDASNRACVVANGTVCQAVPTRTLEEVLDALAPPRINVVKVDIEGHECNVFAANSSGEFMRRWAPDLIQFEAKQARVDACMRRIVGAHGYRFGSRFGNDQNTVAVRRRGESFVSAT
jgi:FkbM family methyltransferase